MSAPCPGESAPGQQSWRLETVRVERVSAVECLIAIVHTVSVAVRDVRIGADLRFDVIGQPVAI